MGILGAVEEVERRVHAGGRWRGEGSGRRQVVLLILLILLGMRACLSLACLWYCIVTATGFHPSWKLAPHRTSLIVR